jgi:hypothetical protein
MDIYAKLGLNSLVLLDELSNFIQLFDMLLMQVVKLLFCCKKSCFVETLREEHKCFFLS